MGSPLTLIFLLIAVCPLAVANTGDVYKCTSAQGSITFQDHACPTDAAETAIHLAVPPVSMSASADNGESAMPSPPARPSPAPDAKPSAKPLPPLWVCTRPEDGSNYVSRDGVIVPRMVPAGILGVPGQSLSSAYGGSTGIGVSAPGVRRIPVDKSPQAAVAGDYIAVQDTCERATPEQTCNYLQEQYDQIHQKLKRAFKDERAVLQPQEDELNQQLDGC